MMLPTRPGRFSFVDEGEAVRRLGIERDALLTLVNSGRLRAYPGVNKGYFFRVNDLETLAAELHPASAEVVAEEPDEEEEAANPRKQHDPAYKVHLRLAADLKWYDLTDDDLRAYVRELHPSAYEKQRGNVARVVARLERLIALMDEAAAQWRSQAAAPQPITLTPRRPPAPPAQPAQTATSAQPAEAAEATASTEAAPKAPAKRKPRAARASTTLAAPKPTRSRKKSAAQATGE